MSRVSRLGERCHRSRVAALALLAGLIMSAPALAASRLEAITEFSLACRVAGNSDTSTAGADGNGAVLGWEGGLFLHADRPLAWGPSVSVTAGRRSAVAAARLRLRHRFPGTGRYLDLSPGVAFAVSHENREPAGPGLVCGADYGLAPWCAATLQFERLPMRNGPHGALTNLNLGMKVGGRTGLLAGSAMLVAAALAAVAVAAALSESGAW